MALFDKKTAKKAPAKKAVAKKVKKEKVAPTSRKEIKKHVGNDGRFEGVLVRPWLSEKAILGMEKGVYTFAVPPRASKTEIVKAVQYAYNVTPTKVHMVNLPAKKKALRSKRGIGTRSRRHKAYVYLAKGDTIQF